MFNIINILFGDNNCVVKFVHRKEKYIRLQKTNRFNLNKNFFQK